jgi:hypothetical protein
MASRFSAGGVPPGRYFVRVRARDAAGTSGPSNESILSVGVPAVAAPTGLTVVVNGNTSHAVVAGAERRRAALGLLGEVGGSCLDDRE